MPAARHPLAGRCALGGGIGFALATAVAPFVYFFVVEAVEEHVRERITDVTAASVIVFFVVWGALSAAGLALAFRPPVRRVLMVLQGAVGFGLGGPLAVQLHRTLGIASYAFFGAVVGIALGLGTRAGMAWGAVLGGAGVSLALALAAPFEDLAAYVVTVLLMGAAGAVLGAGIGQCEPDRRRSLAWADVWTFVYRRVAVVGALAILLPIQVGAAVLGPIRKAPRFCFDELPVPLGAIPAAVADFDGDGDIDAVQAWSETPVPALLRNVGGGSLSADPALPDRRALPLATGDVDGDGDVDVARVESEPGTKRGERPTWRAVLFRNDGKGGFIPDEPVAVGDEPHEVAMADIDGDGAPDVVVSDDAGVQILLSRGELSEPGPRLDGAGRLLAVGDIDGDGRADILAREEQVDGLVLHRSTAGGGFERSVLTGPGSTKTEYVADVVLADLDGDDDLDVAISDYEEVVVLANDGGGRFPTEAVGLGRGRTGIDWVSAGDLDGDGDLDLVASDPPDHEDERGGILWAWENHGDGRWSDVSRVGLTYRKALAGDFDGDGRDDLLVGLFAAGESAWRLLVSRDC